MTLEPGPNWTDILTAVGTVGATIVALIAAGAAIWIARWSDKRAEDRMVAERAAADARLHEELHHAAEQIREEHLTVQHHEQLVAAYQVQVTPVSLDAGTDGKQPARDPDEPVERAGVLVINHGAYTIIKIQAQLCVGGNGLIGYARTEHRSAFERLPAELREGQVREGWPVKSATLCPVDLGMRFTSDVMATKFLRDSYPIVRWQDRWGTWWEHKRGVVEKIDESDPWMP